MMSKFEECRSPVFLIFGDATVEDGLHCFQWVAGLLMLLVAIVCQIIWWWIGWRLIVFCRRRETKVEKVEVEP